MAKGRKTGGRQAGTPNKSTQAAREAIARFVDGNSDKLQEWLDQIAADKGPQAAFECFASMLEYHVPKLARTETTGKDGGPQEWVIRWGDPK
jgi:hypothetical protein